MGERAEPYMNSSYICKKVGRLDISYELHQDELREGNHHITGTDRMATPHKFDDYNSTRRHR